MKEGKLNGRGESTSFKNGRSSILPQFSKNHGSTTAFSELALILTFSGLVLLQMDVFQVEERGFYVKILCNRGGGVAVSLYKALDV